MPVVIRNLSDFLLDAQRAGEGECIEREAVDVALQYLHEIKNFGFNPYFLSIGDDWPKQFFDSLGRVSSGPIVVELPSKLAAGIRNYEDRLREVRAKNREIDIENSATLAMFEVLGRYPEAEGLCPA